MLRMFYFSGTGNARNVALWMVEAWREGGREADVVDLAKVDPRTVQIGPEDEVGFSSPTHGFNFPPITLSFLFRFPRAPAKNNAFVFNTRAGVRILGWCAPGLTGAAQLIAAATLWSKGYRVRAMRPIDLPSNWISLHPGLGKPAVSDIYARCHRIMRECAGRLLNGRTDYRALWDLPQDLLIAPIAVGYYLVGRFLFAKSFVASAACDNCGACIKQCPVKAIRLVEGRPFWSFDCESCMRCMSNCPKRAIETAHGFVLGSLAVFSAVLHYLVYPFLSAKIPYLMSATLPARVLRNVLEPVLMLVTLKLAYHLLHRARRYRIIDRLMTLTSLTHFQFWRRYRAPQQRT